MKKYLMLIVVNTIYLSSAIANNKSSEAVNLLKLSAARLNELKTISYLYKREINNYKNSYFNKTSANCFINFEKKSDPNLFNFQFLSFDGSKQIYNGMEYFILENNDKTIEVTTKPSAKTLNSLSYFYNAIPVLRNMLSKLADDDSVSKSKKDTIINGSTFNIINLGLKNKALDYLDGYRNFSIKFDTYYKLILDSKTHLPYQIIETNSLDKDRYNTITTFLNLQSAPANPSELSWFYSTYLKEYHLRQINSYDDKKDVEFFLYREKPAYSMLYNGQGLAQKLGIYSYPTIVIIDKKGKVIQLFNGFDFEEIDRVIAASL